MSTKQLEISTDPEVKEALKKQKINSLLCDKRWKKILEDVHKLAEDIQRAREEFEVDELISMEKR